MLWLLGLGLALADGEVEQVDWREVKALRKVEPRYPSEARRLNIAKDSCRVDFTIDERGHPTSVEVSLCNEVFHENTLKAAYKWRFVPYRSEDGVAMSSRFVLKLTFVNGEPPSSSTIPETDEDDTLVWLGGGTRLPYSLGADPSDGWGMVAILETTFYDDSTIGFGLRFEHLLMPDDTSVNRFSTAVSLGYLVLNRKHLQIGPDFQVGAGLGFWRDDDFNVGFGGSVSVGLPVKIITGRTTDVSVRPYLNTGYYLLSGGLPIPPQVGVEAALGFR